MYLGKKNVDHTKSRDQMHPKLQYLRRGVVDGPGDGENPGDGAMVGGGVGVAAPPSITPGGGVGGVRYPEVTFFVFSNTHDGSLQQRGSLELGTSLHSGGKSPYLGHLLERIKISV